MKFIRSIFTNSIIALICTMLAVFGVGMGLLSWRQGDLLPWGILYTAAGIAIFILGKRIGDQGDTSYDTQPNRKRKYF